MPHMLDEFREMAAFPVSSIIMKEERWEIL